MAYTDDLDPRRDKQAPVMAPLGSPAAAPAAGGGAPGAGGMVSAAPAAPQAHGGGHGTGFVNLERYVGANASGAQNMANTIGGNVAQQGAQTMADAAQLQGDMAHSTAATAGAVNPALQAKLGAEAQRATMGAQALQTPGGIGALLTQQYGTGGGYGAGMRGFDSFLTGYAGGNQFQALGNQYGGLDKYVSGLGSGYTPQVVNNTGGLHGGPPAHQPITMDSGTPAAPSGPSGGGGGRDGGASAQKKRRMA